VGISLEITDGRSATPCGYDACKEVPHTPTPQSIPFRSVNNCFDLTGKAPDHSCDQRLGLQMPRALGEQGATLFISARTPSEVEQVVKNLEAAG